MYQSSSIVTTTTTADGTPVVFDVDYITKTVSVYVAGEYRGTWNSRSAAKLALELVDVQVKK